MKRITDVLIIGGGVIGTAIAYYLRKRDADVMLLERGAIGGQASSVAAGLLAPLGPLPGAGPLADLLLASFALFPALVPELEAASGLHLGYERLGALRIVRNPKRVGHLQKRMQAWEPLGLPLSWLNGEEARQQEPLLGPGVCAAVYAPAESQIRASQVVRAFATVASNLGVSIKSHTEVSSLCKAGKRVTGAMTTQGEHIACQHLVIATGAWAADCLHWLDLDLPVSPLHGQLLCLQGTTSSLLLKHMIFSEGIYVTPRGADLLVGATKEEQGFSVRVTEKGLATLHEKAARCLPLLKESGRASARAGLRPSTPDRAPILGSVPEWENVTLAVGHNSSGILLSPITGATIAELILTGVEPALIRPFSSTRFQSPDVR